MLASDVINRAARILFDTSNVRWTDNPELLNYVNDGMRQVVLYRPDANSVNEAVKLAEGSKQDLSSIANSTPIRLLRVTRNMGSGGSTAGKAIRPADRLALDSEITDWHNVANKDTTILHYVFDDVDPLTFYVYPPSDSSNAGGTDVYVEVVYSAVPTEATAVGDTLDLNDQWINPLVDWVLYRAHSKEADYAGNPQLAEQYRNRFIEELQRTMQVEWSTSRQRASAAMSKNVQSGGGGGPV